MCFSSISHFQVLDNPIIHEKSTISSQHNDFHQYHIQRVTCHAKYKMNHDSSHRSYVVIKKLLTISPNENTMSRISFIDFRVQEITWLHTNISLRNNWTNDEPKLLSIFYPKSLPLIITILPSNNSFLYSKSIPQISTIYPRLTKAEFVQLETVIKPISV